MTEVAPHAGRRARREAEARQGGQDTTLNQPPYGHAPTPHAHHAGAPVMQVPDTAAFASASAYPQATRGGAVPAWNAGANAFAPSGGRGPAAGHGTQSAYAAPGGQPANGAANGYRVAATNGYATAAHGRPYTPPSAPAPPAVPPPPPAPRQGPGGDAKAPRVSDLRPRGDAAHGGHGGSQGFSGPDGGGDLRGRHATGWGQGFGRVVGWTLIGSLVPGTGMIAAGRRVLGWMVVLLCLGLAASAASVLVLTHPMEFLTREVISRPDRLTYLAWAIVGGGVLWAAHVVATNMSLRRFATLTGTQSLLSWVLVTVLVGGGVAMAVSGAQNTQLSGDTLSSIFSGTQLSAGARRPDATKPDPWAGTPRINVLLIGSDAGADRTGVRTDSLAVASIETHTGRTVLFQLPRNLEHVPFPPGTKQAEDYPDGFYCAQHACMINALWQFGVEHKDQYYKGVKNPGLTATVQGVEQTLGIKIDDYAMLDLRGFMQFIDAVGGLTVNVGDKRIPVGGHRNPVTGVETGVTSYLKPGRQHLNGYQTLWFARSRSESDDFERMRRQRCVIYDVTQQINPQSVALNLTAVLKAAKDNIRTSIPLSDLDAWISLALRVKGHVRSVAFTNQVISSGDPDFEKIHKKVEGALEAPATATATTTPTPTPSATAPGKKKKATTSPTPTVPENGDAIDLAQVC